MSSVVKYTFACTILCAHVCAVFNQTPQHNEICTFAREVQRSLVEVIAGVNVSAVLQQQTNNCCVTTETRSMKCPLAIKSYKCK